MAGSAEAFDRGSVTVPLAIPVLLSENIARAAETYAGFGFNVIPASPDYLILRRGGVELHVSSVARVPLPSCVSAYIRVANVEEWHAAFRGGGAQGLSSPVEKPWGLREFHYVDEDGNLLNVGEMLP